MSKYVIKILLLGITLSSISSFGQNNLVKNTFSDKKIWRFYDGYLNRKKKDIIISDSSMTFVLGDPIRAESKLIEPLKQGEVYKLSFDVISKSKDVSLAEYGISFMPKKGKFEREDSSVEFLTDDEHIEYPYIRLVDSVYMNVKKHFNYYVLSEGNEIKMIIRKIPGLVVDSLKKPILISLSNIELVTIGNEKGNSINNLVSNNDFEYYPSCPTSIGYPNFYKWQETENVRYERIDSRDKVIKTNHSVSLSNDKHSSADLFLLLDSPDLVCDCSHFDTIIAPKPKSGRCYARIGIGAENSIYQTEYLQTKLKNKLKDGEEYQIEFYYRLAPYSVIDVNRLGVKISSIPFSMDKLYGEIKHKRQQIATTNLMVDYPIDDSHRDSWVKATIIYTATGGEEYLTIGPFFPKEESFKKVNNHQNETYTEERAIYFIDLVSVKKVGT